MISYSPCFTNVTAQFAGNPKAWIESTRFGFTEKMDNWLQSAIDAALEAGAIIRQASENYKQISLKESNADLVTITDKQVESYLFTKLKSIYPDHVFVGEESNVGSIGNLSEKPTWIIDPVDGTMNFVHEFPFYCVSIGITLDTKAVIGVIYNPVSQQLWYAKQGSGCYKAHAPPNSKITIGDGVRLQGKEPVPAKLANALILTELGSSKQDEHLNPKLEILSKLVRNPIAGRGVRMIGKIV